MNKLTSLPTLPATLKIINSSYNRWFEYELSPSTGTNNLVHAGISMLPVLPAGLLELNVSGNNLTALPTALPVGLTSLLVNDNVKAPYTVVPSSGIQCLPHLPATLTELNCARTLVGCLPNAGAYTVSPPLPWCSITNNVNQCETNPVMSGYTFYDNNSNGIKDAGENFRANVEATSGSGYFAYSNTTGYFELGGAIGTNTVTINPPAYYQAVPTTVTYNFSSYDTVVNRLYALQPIVTVDSVAVSIIPLTTARPGFEHRYRVNYEDLGTTVVSAAMQFTFNASLMAYSSSTLPGVTNNNGILTIPAINLTPGDRGSFDLIFTVNPAAAIGDTIYVAVQASYNAATTADSSYAVISGAFDPNDKRATPVLTAAEVTNGKYIDYLVRFQNTGTDTAFHVVITDSLSSQLNAASFQMIAASHPARIKRNGNALGFEFINILLPDSNVNEVLSHGYIRFRVQPNSNVLAGIIPNTANIYFDYNVPVLTNVANTRIDASVVPVRLIRFSGTADKLNQAHLTWATAEEINTSYFEIERSSDGRSFKTVGITAAYGFGGHQYNFETSMENAVNYYRLKIVDRDGHFTNSQIIKLQLPVKSSSFVILSNPVAGNLRIETYNEKLKGTQGLLVDNTGKRVYSFLITGGKQHLDVSFLPNGIYLLVEGGETHRFTIMQ